jgi:hypothetical protein
MAFGSIISGARSSKKGQRTHDDAMIDPLLRGLVMRKSQASSISVENLLAAWQ